LQKFIVVPEPPRMETRFGNSRKLEDPEADIAVSGAFAYTCPPLPSKASLLQRLEVGVVVAFARGYHDAGIAQFFPLSVA
jgi:hypothetical protein